MSNATSRLLNEAAQAVHAVDPTEQPVLTLLATDGPSPWLLGGLGPMGLLLVRRYFITLTQRSIYVHSCPGVKSSPTELLLVTALDQTQDLVADVRRRPLWNKLWLRLPGRKKPVRLWVTRASRAKLEQLLATLEQTATTAQV